MSLNDRFSGIGKKPELIHLSGNVQQLQTASLKNQRLAQQMANWPSVLSALRNIPSLKHRLGRGNIKARLSRPLMRGGLHGVARRSGKLRGRGPSLRGTLSVRCVGSMRGNGKRFNIYSILSKKNIFQLTTPWRGMFVGHGRGGGRRWAESRPVPTREELDEQLDDYMSMTKSHLDAQLDAYMAEVDSGDFL
uniref:Chromatin target of PRMT1b n=1 Tax=Astyanax mexicanus TaxID=7994 RepID=A0A8B9KWS3_ASTMX